MMGQDFWEDVDIDACVIEEEISRLAKMLYKQYGPSFDEVDVLQMNNPIGDARSLLLTQVLRLIKEDCLVPERTGKL